MYTSGKRGSSVGEMYVNDVTSTVNVRTTHCMLLSSHNLLSTSDKSEQLAGLQLLIVHSICACTVWRCLRLARIRSKSELSPHVSAKKTAKDFTGPEFHTCTQPVTFNNACFTGAHGLARRNYTLSKEKYAVCGLFVQKFSRCDVHSAS